MIHSCLGTAGMSISCSSCMESRPAPVVLLSDHTGHCCWFKWWEWPDLALPKTWGWWCSRCWELVLCPCCVVEGVKETCYRHSLAASCGPWWFACVAWSDSDDCVVAYNLPRASLGFSGLLLFLNMERKWYRRSSFFSFHLGEFGQLACLSSLLLSVREEW